MLQAIIENNPDLEFLIADGFDEAIIGVDLLSERIIYSVSKCLKILCRDMPEEEAIEYFEYNVVGAYMGKNTPIWCYDNYN